MLWLWLALFQFLVSDLKSPDMSLLKIMVKDTIYKPIMTAVTQSSVGSNSLGISITTVLECYSKTTVTATIGRRPSTATKSWLSTRPKRVAKGSILSTMTLKKNWTNNWMSSLSHGAPGTVTLSGEMGTITFLNTSTTMSIFTWDQRTGPFSSLLMLQKQIIMIM